ncbi:uncharacterized protein LOC6605981 isoform X2 [Drosophila sechellia]|uniref:Transformer, isoform B n=3 Tax=melanogaster subgroup TaxID=32351 RepID=A0A0J9RWV8_DROSI|nr:uncharacterized protein LOC6605981 isoform X2 [Drosophila sechellia]XP_016032195.1 uncharacterized protein LOC6738353 isoform X2 [Drosophila simulans]XP_033160643.1 uncharacterized protein LOC117141347 isoform X2 [Drosophila mauritiana]EDW41779.1 tra [Drosophila sechellia]KMZ00078.1 transformer, isoform B [Drosophila simulans]
MKMDADSSGTEHRVSYCVKCEMDENERCTTRQRKRS